MSRTLLAMLALATWACSDRYVINFDARSEAGAADDVAGADTGAVLGDDTVTVDDGPEPLEPTPGPQQAVADDPLLDVLDQSVGEPTQARTADPSRDPAAAPQTVGESCNAFSVRAVLATEPAEEYLPSGAWSFAESEPTLFVHVVVTGVAGTAHELTFDFYVPDGYLYRRDFIKLRAGEVTGGIRGYPWEYVDAASFPEGWVVTYPLQLAGSDIDTWNIHGGWRLAVSIDDDPTPVVSAWFEITP